MNLLRIACLLAAVCGIAAAQTGEETAVRGSRRIMGTYCEVQAYHRDEQAARRAIDAALDEMVRVDRLLSNYDPASELSAMNRAAAREPFHPSPELFDFVTACRRYHDITKGAFDPTVGALVRAWGFFSRNPARPTPQAMADAKRVSGFDKVRTDEARRTVAYTVPGLELDPGGIGKGYAVDRAVDVLRKGGIEAALVSAGGSTIYGIGHPPGRDAWRVAIKNPSAPDRPFGVARLRDAALSTSGASEQSVVVDGHRYSHIFDPRSGMPVEDMCQATVVAPTASDSEALTKAAFILPREQASAILSPRGGVHVMRVEGACEDRTRPWIAPWSGAVIER